jgi:hypothetical protein
MKANNIHDPERRASLRPLVLKVQDAIVSAGDSAR